MKSTEKHKENFKKSSDLAEWSSMKLLQAKLCLRLNPESWKHFETEAREQSKSDDSYLVFETHQHLSTNF